MTTDTKAIIGTILATAIALGGLVMNRIGNVETEVRSVRTELGDVRTELSDRINQLDIRLNGRIDGLRTELVGRMDRLRDEMLENYHLLDARMRTIEQGFARIDQRLDTLERAVIPSAEPAQ